MLLEYTAYNLIKNVFFDFVNGVECDFYLNACRSVTLEISLLLRLATRNDKKTEREKVEKKMGPMSTCKGHC